MNSILDQLDHPPSRTRGKRQPCAIIRHQQHIRAFLARQ